MNVAEIHQLVQSLGALAGMASAYLSFREQKKDIGPRELEHMLAEAEVARHVPVSDEVVRVAALIPQGIFDALKDRVDRAQKKYVKVIRSLNTPAAELDESYHKAREEICEVLKVMKKHNDDQLPDDEELEKLWNSFQCVDFA